MGLVCVAHHSEVLPLQSVFGVMIALFFCLKLPATPAWLLLRLILQADVWSCFLPILHGTLRLIERQKTPTPRTLPERQKVPG